MNIVLNEHECANEYLLSKSMGKKPFDTLNVIARYYYDCGKTKGEVTALLSSFILQCDSSASIPKWTRIIDAAANVAQKRKTIMIDFIPISKSEIEKVKSVQTTQGQRLAFTLLCLSKYWNIVNDRDDNWVNSKDSEIMHMANIHTSIKRQSMMYHTLRDMDMIQFSRIIDNTNVRVNFSDDGDAEIKITDLRNLGYQYMMYLGGPYMECKNCGIITKRNHTTNGCKIRYSQNQMYCKECAARLIVQNNVNSVMKYRNAKRYEMGNEPEKINKMLDSE